MKSSLLMDFSVDKENSKIYVKREFAAPLNRVWAAWTESELLDQWWAPKPWKARTKSMDFREGGYWLYAMVGPDGTEHWGRVDYKRIAPLKSFTAQDVFCDEEGKTNPDLPKANWENDFQEGENSVIVNIEVKYNDLSELEKVLEMGLKEGFTAALENLDQLLTNLGK
ncbi:MAG: SRPBCC domain-containing protein [Anditalea sp.]